MKNVSWICINGAIVYVAISDFACPDMPANPTPTDYTTAINAIETGVANSTHPLSFQNWSHLMVETVEMIDEYGDTKSVKLACWTEYARRIKPKGKISLDVKNCTDPYIAQVLTWEKFTEDTASNTFYEHKKYVCKTPPSIVCKIVTCPDEETGVFNTYYFMPTTVSGSIVTKLQDYCENDFEWAKIDLDVLSGGCSFKVTRTFDKTLNEDAPFK